MTEAGTKNLERGEWPLRPRVMSTLVYMYSHYEQFVANFMTVTLASTTVTITVTNRNSTTRYNGKGFDHCLCPLKANYNSNNKNNNNNNKNKRCTTQGIIFLPTSIQYPLNRLHFNKNGDSMEKTTNSVTVCLPGSQLVTLLLERVDDEKVATFFVIQCDRWLKRLLLTSVVLRNSRWAGDRLRQSYHVT